MIVTITRGPSTEKGTFGVLDIDGIPFCVTCELPWKDNAPRRSCIPTGTYECKSYTSAKYPNVWQVMDVPNRDKILIHQGNTINDIQGCILVGRSFTEIKGLPAVAPSKPVLELLRAFLPKSFTLTIN